MLETLTSRQKEVVIRLFGIRQKKETLQSIADTQDCTRERIRQVKLESLRKLRKVIRLYPEAQKIKKEIMRKINIYGYAKECDLAPDGYSLLILHLIAGIEPMKLDKKIYHRSWRLSSLHDEDAKILIDLQVQDLINGIYPLDYVRIKKGVFMIDNFYFYKPYMKSLGDKARFIIGDKIMRVRDILEEVSSFFYRDKKKPGRTSINNMLILDPRFILVSKGKYKLNKKYDSKNVSATKTTGRKTYIK